MTLELVVLFPVILLVIFSVVQAANFYYARSVALAAAQEGLRVAKAEDGSRDAGERSAETFLSRAADGVLTQTDVRVTRDGARAVVTVTGRPPSVLPGVRNFFVSQTASAPVERFTAPVEVP